MEQLEVKQRESSIVLVGQFDPLLMSPHWFVKQGMIPQEDIDESLAIELVYKELTKFSLANIFVEIQPGTLVLRSNHESFDYKIQDIALGILAALKGAGVTALGLNLYSDIYFKSLDAWHKIGDLITPKSVWHEAMPESGNAGMASVQMQLNKPSGEVGVYNFTVGWLDQPQTTRFSLNNHFDSKPIENNRRPPSKNKGSDIHAFDPIAIVSAYWQQSLEYQAHLVDSILSQAWKE
ncbi:hypothetical protein [Pseudomonas sp. Pse1]|uniref:hypothetical protein n=1 Tax=Pseudomonas sp. Pse1 TaxID=2926020 RepID=UPI002117EF77|nr:hypothetical protein [Pseudomonas sp. Pse1]